MRDDVDVRWASDRDRLLPGERPESQYRDDADHWVRVYRDLLAFNTAVVESMAQRVKSSPQADGPGMPDLELLGTHLERLRWRLSFWEGRLAELGSTAGQTG